MRLDHYVIVDHISTHLIGGAAIAARRLHEGLLSAGVDSRFWHAHPDETTGEDATLHHMDERFHRPFRWGKSISRRRHRSRFVRLWRDWERCGQGRPSGLELFSLPRLIQPTPYRPDAGRADILHLHWIAFSIDYPSFFASVPASLPIVWTLHDMNPFTGGCHYSGGCEAFLTHCRCCPQLGHPSEKDVSNESFRVKRRALHRKNLHVVTPSQWMMREAARSRILEHAKSVRQINYGLDVSLFAPQTKPQARRSLGLAQDRVVIAFGAASIDNQRKGLHHLLSALAQLECRSQVLGLVFGGGNLPETSHSLPPFHSTGFIDDPRRQATLYSAADVFVLPSLEDNSPQTGLEAMACGTPVVAFDSGGISDYVRPYDTGLLAKVGQPTDLARNIAWLVDRPQQRQRMGENARAMVVREFRSDLQASSYLRLYRQLLSQTDWRRRQAA